MCTRYHITQIPSIWTICLLFSLAVILTGCVGWSESATQSSPLLPSETPLSSLPDLTIDSVWLETEGPRLCTEAESGLNIHIRIINQGDGPAASFLVSALDRQEIIEGLEQGESFEVKFTSYQATILVEVDLAEQIIESDETNNRYLAQIPLPTLPVECYPTPTPAVQIQAPAATLSGHTGKVLNLAFSPDGNLIASGSVDNTLRLWRADQAVLLRTMQGHPFPVTAVKFSPNGANLATGSTDGLIRLWSVSNGLLNRTLQAHGGSILDLQYSPDGRWLASSAEDFTVRLWNPATGRLVQTVDEGMAQVNGLAFSPDSRLLAWVEGDGSLKVWRLTDGAWLLNARNIYQPATRIVFSPDQTLLVAGYRDGRLQFWNYRDGALLETINRHNSAITGLAFSNDSKWLVSSAQDSAILVWRIVHHEASANLPGTTEPEFDATLAREYRDHNGQVNDLAFSPRGNLIASAGDDGLIFLWSFPPE